MCVVVVAHAVTLGIVASRSRTYSNLCMQWMLVQCCVDCRRWNDLSIVCANVDGRKYSFHRLIDLQCTTIRTMMSG